MNRLVGIAILLLPLISFGATESFTVSMRIVEGISLSDQSKGHYKVEGNQNLNLTITSSSKIKSVNNSNRVRSVQLVGDRKVLTVVNN